MLEPRQDSQLERSGLMSRNSPTSSRDRRKRPRASEESEDSELKDSAHKWQTSQESPCISEAMFIASEKFATRAVHYMQDRLRREEIPVTKNTIKELQTAYGLRIQNLFYGCYIKTEHLYEAAMAGDVQVVLNTLGERRKPLKRKSVEQILAERPEWRPLVGFCIQLLKENPTTTHKELEGR